MTEKRRRKPKRKPVLGSTTPGHSLLLNTNKRRRNTTISKESDWACLPEALLVLIVDRLVTLSDYVRFSAVCIPWHAVALENYHGERRCKLSMHQPPLLFLTHTHLSKEGETTIGIHSVSQNKTYELKSFMPIGSKRWFGSSHGWLISVDNNFVITLSNPFCSKVKGGDGNICLPPVLHRHCYFIKKVLVVPDNSAVILSYNEGLAPDKLAFIRPGDKGWTFIKNINHDRVIDIIYSKGLFYALYMFGSVKSLDIGEHRPKLKMVSPKYCSTASSQEKNYIVESAGGNILRIVRIVRILNIVDDELPRREVTKGFEVFNLLVLNGTKKWVETKDLNLLGDGALFLDDNTCTYVPASDFLGCHPNSIYFVDYGFLGYDHPTSVRASTPYDMGIFYLGDGSFQWHSVTKLMSSPKSMSRPIWIQPTFQGKRA